MFGLLLLVYFMNTKFVMYISDFRCFLFCNESMCTHMYVCMYVLSPLVRLHSLGLSFRSLFFVDSVTGCAVACGFPRFVSSVA